MEYSIEKAYEIFERMQKQDEKDLVELNQRMEALQEKLEKVRNKVRKPK